MKNRWSSAGACRGPPQDRPGSAPGTIRPHPLLLAAKESHGRRMGRRHGIPIRRALRFRHQWNAEARCVPSMARRVSGAPDIQAGTPARVSQPAPSPIPAATKEAPCAARNTSLRSPQAIPQPPASFEYRLSTASSLGNCGRSIVRDRMPMPIMATRLGVVFFAAGLAFCWVLPIVVSVVDFRD